MVEPSFQRFSLTGVQSTILPILWYMQHAIKQKITVNGVSLAHQRHKKTPKDFALTEMASLLPSAWVSHETIAELLRLFHNPES